MIRKYLSTAYISITFSGGIFKIHTRVFKKNNIIKDLEKEFQTKEAMINFLQEDVKEYYFYYLSIFFESVGQGALPDIQPQTLEKFSINKNDITLVNLKHFYIYANNQELNKLRAAFEGKEIDVDFIISPFAILYRQIQHLNAFNSDKNVFYILKYENYITLLIIKNKKLLFSTFFYTSQNNSSQITSENDYIKSDVEKIIEKKEEEDELDLFKDSDAVFENIDNIEDIDSLSLDTVEELENQTKEEDLTTFAIDMNLFDCMKTALLEYYSSDIYDSEFIESIVIFSDQQISQSVIDLIKDELLIKPQIYEINLHEQIINLMKESL